MAKHIYIEPGTGKFKSNSELVTDIRFSGVYGDGNPNKNTTLSFKVDGSECVARSIYINFPPVSTKEDWIEVFFKHADVVIDQKLSHGIN